MVQRLFSAVLCPFNLLAVRFPVMAIFVAAAIIKLIVQLARNQKFRICRYGTPPFLAPRTIYGKALSWSSGKLIYTFSCGGDRCCPVECQAVINLQP
ncbi:uncharacterized protein BJ212DRAFT_1413389 [Suillus subaureus]|uniref:Uncharacterized protein n=1 Tax=Suillus subaureus TaxID=48587 RepID=A0A9P7ARC2_9AGAM|nr:uncharacterized protein BJ212DRAFT_1413389 [Suillus subaureus]KAG1794072.1 hypothetical protein BJ212DRAFT_1413389 [Suillus subaureus]